MKYIILLCLILLLFSFSFESKKTYKEKDKDPYKIKGTIKVKNPELFKCSRMQSHCFRGCADISTAAREQKKKCSSRCRRSYEECKSKISSE